MRFKWIKSLLCGACFGLMALAVGSQEALDDGTQSPSLTPNEVVEATATSIAEELDGQQAHLKDNPAELYALIDGLLLPHFDTRYAGRLVLGNHWKNATVEQRDRFIDVFYQFLVQSYADGILGFEQESLMILPPAGESDGKRAVVKTTIRMEDGNVVPVNYSMRNSSAGWRVYDVRIEGVSYIQNYRNQLNAEIKALGIDAVIERLLVEISESAGTKET
jgi:phospholipid transport system substrate-binding protein